MKSYVLPVVSNGRMVQTQLSTGSTIITNNLPVSDGQGQVLPNTQYRKKPVDLFAATTARTILVSERYHQSCQLTKGDSKFSGCSSYFQLMPMHPPQRGNLNMLDGRLRASVKSQNLNLAQTMAEYRQTAKLFTSLTMDVVTTFRTIRAGRGFSEFVRYLQRPRNAIDISIANRWLEYQYGVRPLMQDIHGSAEALATKIRTGMWKYSSAHETSKDYANLTGNFLRDFGGSLTVRSTYSYRSRCRYKISDPALKQLAQLGITNPALLAWELIPYSFVVDWLIPVGDFLSSLDALNGTSQLQVVRGCFNRADYELVVGGSSSKSFGTDCYRSQVDNSLSLPSLAYKPSSSFKSVANGLALLRQLRR